MFVVFRVTSNLDALKGEDIPEYVSQDSSEADIPCLPTEHGSVLGSGLE